MGRGGRGGRVFYGARGRVASRGAVGEETHSQKSHASGDVFGNAAGGLGPMEGGGPKHPPGGVL